MALPWAVVVPDGAEIGGVLGRAMDGGGSRALKGKELLGDAINIHEALSCLGISDQCCPVI